MSARLCQHSPPPSPADQLCPPNQLLRSAVARMPAGCHSLESRPVSRALQNGRMTQAMSATLSESTVEERTSFSSRMVVPGLVLGIRGHPPAPLPSVTATMLVLSHLEANRWGSVMRRCILTTDAQRQRALALSKLFKSQHRVLRSIWRSLTFGP